ncbi:MAG TPA: mechanosensitive ion channel domain-containing protein [Pseudomonadales bacterium]|nr:mechanosensitive ion channel domain-containing protein [Pseudomonadales bacterium]
MTDKVDTVQRIYEFVIQFLVGYSFQLFGAIVILVAGVIVAGWTAKALLRAQERRNVDVTLRQFIASVVRLLVIGLAVVIALSNLGISITPFIAAIGGLAVGASLALQGPISNYGAGLVIILTRVFRVGDTITVQGCSGVVTDITLAATVLKAEDGEDIIIPNKQIAGEIHRNSRANRIVEGRIGIAYGENLERAVGLVRAAVVAFDGAATEPKPQIGVEAFGDYAIAIGYRVWLPTERYFDLMYRLNLAIVQSLEAGGIQVSAPRKL